MKMSGASSISSSKTRVSGSRSSSNKSEHQRILSLLMVNRAFPTYPCTMLIARTDLLKGKMRSDLKVI